MKFTSSMTEPFPSDMRTQLFPLCCGLNTLSGFKNYVTAEKSEIVKKIKESLAAIPDFQVFKGEHMHPESCLLVLNSGQRQSQKIVDAVTECGFVEVGTFGAWSGTASLWMRSPTFTTTNTIKSGKAA